MIYDQSLTEVAATLVMAATAGALALWLRQPLIVAFIIVGIIVGPAAFDWVSSEQFDLLAELGIGLLLFVVGLKLDPSLIRSVGWVAVTAGLGQIVVTFCLGYAVAWLFDMHGLSAFYLAAALAFSSTIIIVKLLSDKREIDALHGRIALGILIVQDIVVVFLMLALAAYESGESAAKFSSELVGVLFKGSAFLLGVALTARFVMPALLHSMARMPELLILFGVAWAIGLAALGMQLGFSKEVGSFIAGVSLASTPYRTVISVRLVSLRDFLLLFFFIDLGVHIDVAHLQQTLWPALALSALVLVAKPLLTTILVGWVGYSKRTSALSGLTMGQISEFSLILTAMGLSMGHIDEQTMGIITLVGLLSIGLSTYMIFYTQKIYERLEPWLSFVQRSRYKVREQAFNEYITPKYTTDVIILGLGRYGGQIATELKRRGYHPLGVDFDPDNLLHWHKEGVSTLYGDVDDPEMFHVLPLSQVSWVISTIATGDHISALLHGLKQNQYQGKTAVIVRGNKMQREFDGEGIDLILMPFLDAAKEAVDLIVDDTHGNAKNHHTAGLG